MKKFLFGLGAMNKVILFFRNLFFRKLLPWFLGALGMLLTMIITDDFHNVPMLIMLSIFVIGAYLSSSHSDVHFLNDTDLLDKKIKKLFKKYGYKAGIFIFLYYLVRDTTLYIIIPYLIYRGLL